MRYQKFELFPTNVLRVDCSNTITLENCQNMINDIENLCVKKDALQIDEFTPLYQSKPFLFLSDCPPVWKKLQETFHQACQLYLQETSNFCNNQEKLEITGSRAWFYKGWKSLNKKESNPWHAHNPAFLSGVFYLKVPTNNDAVEGGTEFMDPRQNEAKNTRNSYLPGIENTWVIFPSWMYHKSNQCASEDPRYVIAADLYVKVK